MYLRLYLWKEKRKGCVWGRKKVVFEKVGRKKFISEEGQRRRWYLEGKRKNAVSRGIRGIKVVSQLLTQEKVSILIPDSGKR